MFKKTLISLAVASSLGLTGCFSGGGAGDNADPEYRIEDTNIDQTLVRPVFDPILTSPTFDIPANFDLVLLLGAGQSTNYDFTGFTTGTDPASNMVKDLAGYSTTAPILIRFNGSIDPETVVLGQTVHLVPINMNPVSDSTPSIELTANPSFIDSTNPFDTTKLAAQRVRAEVVSLDGGSNNAIRITPLEPLEDQTKYLVLVTDGVTGEDGRPTEQSVPYAQIAGDGPLGNAGFASIRDLLNGALDLSVGWLSANGISQDVTLAYTMTTENTKTVFNALTSPATYLTQLGEQVVLYSALQVVRENLSPTATASTVFAALQDALSDEPENAELALKVGQAVAPYISNPSLGQTVVGSVVSSLPFPKPRPTAFYQSTIRTADNLPAIALSGNLALEQAAENVNVVEGAIQLPYYLELPGEGGSGLVTGLWRGSEALETGLNNTIDTLKGSYPTLSNFKFPRDNDGTLNLTQYMPFPEENAKVAVPVTVFYPAAGCATFDDVVIFQHGITVDRSAATIPAINLAAQSQLNFGLCVATVAIDQPLHGLGGATVGTIPGLTPAANYINPADFPDADYVGERHFNYSTPEGTFSPQLESDIRNVRSGSLFINLTSLQTGRDNLRQGVMDLLNLSATMADSPSFDIDGAGAAYTNNAFAGAEFHFVGHSLGGITGTVFSTLANDPLLRGAYAAIGVPGFSAQYPALQSVSLMNTGGQLTRLVENSPAFSPAILGGLGAAGAAQGTSDFESFLYVFQSAIDGVDPATYGKKLGANTLANGSSLLISEVVGDLTVPNEANVDPLGQALSAPLAGTEPLMALADLGLGGATLADGTELSLISVSNPVAATPAPARGASFYFGQNPCTDANHGTFVAPATPADPDDPICPNGSNTGDAFTSMIKEVIGNVTGGVIPVSDPTVLGDSNTIDSALDQN